jgi:hypothetical protein
MNPNIDEPGGRAQRIMWISVTVAVVFVTVVKPLSKQVKIDRTADSGKLGESQRYPQEAAGHCQAVSCEVHGFTKAGSCMRSLVHVPCPLQIDRTGTRWLESSTFRPDATFRNFTVEDVSSPYRFQTLRSIEQRLQLDALASSATEGSRMYMLELKSSPKQRLHSSDVVPREKDAEFTAKVLKTSRANRLSATTSQSSGFSFKCQSERGKKSRRVPLLAREQVV